jgi:hypothetical protein
MVRFSVIFNYGNIEKIKNNESVGLLTSPVNWIRFEIMVNTYE